MKDSEWWLPWVSGGIFIFAMILSAIPGTGEVREPVEFVPQDSYGVKTIRDYDDDYYEQDYIVMSDQMVDVGARNGEMMVGVSACEGGEYVRIAVSSSILSAGRSDVSIIIGGTEVLESEDTSTCSSVGWFEESIEDVDYSTGATEYWGGRLGNMAFGMAEAELIANAEGDVFLDVGGRQYEWTYEKREDMRGVISSINPAAGP